tara:strand:- start:2395 stop:2976 length:582 start_codon:yes stop_codon:yes gene_type:complete
MACLLANGRGLECKESVGGIRNIYFINYGDMGALTLNTTGELLTDLGEPSTAFQYALNPQSSDFDEAITVSEENGTVFYEQTLNLALPNLSADALKELKILAQGRFQIFVEDNNINEVTGHGDLYLAGAYNGLTVTGGNIGRGKAFGDMSGYNLSLVGREQRAAVLVTAASSAGDALFAGLTTTANEPAITTS